MEVLDLFDNLESLPKNVREIVEFHGDIIGNNATYENCENFLNELIPLGYTFDYYLDATPYNLRQITYTVQDVTRMLLSVLTFTNANANKLHGTKTIKGETYGEQVEHILKMYASTKANTIESGLDDSNWSLLRLTPKLSE